MEKAQKNVMKKLKKTLLRTIITKTIALHFAIVGFITTLIAIIMDAHEQVDMIQNNGLATVLIQLILFTSILLIMRYWTDGWRFRRLENIYHNGNPPATYEEGLKRLKA